MSECVWQPKTLASVTFPIFAAILIQKELLNEMHDDFRNTGTDRPRSKGFQSAREKVSDSFKLTDTVILCQAAATANPVFICCTVRPTLFTI